MKTFVLAFLSSLALILANGCAADRQTSASGRPASSVPGSGASTNDPIFIEYMRILTMDDAAEKEIDRWIAEAEAFEAAGTPAASATLRLKIDQRLKQVREAYERFLERNPKHIDARIAFGSFLMETGQEDDAVVQLEKARELDPKNPTPWNNLANHFGHRGPVIKAFAYYQKAIELDPTEPVYLHNLATTTYLFRTDAKEFYKTNEAGVFDLALTYYERALKLDPTNLVLAVDLAQSYYGIRPMRTNDALTAWTNALNIAKTPVEREGIYLHLARVELNTGHFKEARDHLNLVTNAEMAEMKQRLTRNLETKEKQAQGAVSTNAPSVTAAEALAPKLD